MDLQALERRRLLSVTVVQGYPGFYEVYGDETANAIAISISAADSSFTLDGIRYAEATFIAILTFDGNDSVSVVADGPTPVGAGINAGAGDDDVQLSVAGAIWGESGDDTLRIANSFRGEIYGGQGNDHLEISGECADAEIDAGDGNDRIDASNSAYGVFARGGTGDDTVFGSQYDDRLYGEQGHDLLLGSGGNDVFYAADLENDRIVGGAGADIAVVDACESGVWGVEYLFYV
jgi:Ca2+-binding RTX toxin-like protein